MDYIKRHKLTVFIILVWIVVIAFSYFIYSLFVGSSGLPVYGDRLDGIEDVPITKEQIEKITDDIMSESFVLKVTKPYLSGKILKVVVTVADGAEEKASKALTTKVTDALTDEQKAFYDIEFFVTKYYNCTLEATGAMDEDGNFTESVKVKFSADLSKNEFVEDFGITNKKGKTYNGEQSITITEDGEYIIYGYTKDKMGESDCSIKITKKESNASVVSDTVNSVTTPDFPIIGYQKYGTNSFAWTKSRK